MAKALTNKFIDAIKAGDTRQEIADGGLTGLYLVVQPKPSGAMSWAIRYRHGNKPRKMTIGAYPAFGLKEAREEAKPALRAVTEGRDPATERKALKAELASEDNLVENVLDSFIDRYVTVKNRDSTLRETKRFIDNEIRPKWKGRAIQSITKRDVIALLDGITDRGAPISANRVHAILRRFFNWAVERDILIGSPVVNIKAPGNEVARDRVLTENEIKLVWKACQVIGWPFGPMVKLLLITGQRREEVAGAKWSEFELTSKEPIWIIPKERAKNNKAHAVALSPLAVSIIEKLPKIDGKPGYVLTTNGETSVSGFSKAKSALDAAMLVLCQKEAEDRGDDPASVSITAWRLHDLRRTCASGMAALGQPVHVVEAVLNHKSGSIKGVAAVYNRHDYAEEKRRALIAWSAYVEALFSEKIDSNVINFQSA